MLVISEVSCEASLGPGVVELRSTMKIPFDTLLEVLAVAAAHGREEMNGTDQKERNASQAASLSQGNPFIIPFDIPETAAQASYFVLSLNFRMLGLFPVTSPSVACL